MTITSSSPTSVGASCASCGAPSTGTAFCESCGNPMTVALTEVPTDLPRYVRVAWRICLVSVTALPVVVLLVGLLTFALWRDFWDGAFGVTTAVAAIGVLVVTASAAFAIRLQAPTVARRVGAFVLLGVSLIGYVLALIAINGQYAISGPYWMPIGMALAVSFAPLTVPAMLALLAAWLISSAARGRAYWSIPIALGFALIAGLFSWIVTPIAVLGLVLLTRVLARPAPPGAAAVVPAAAPGGVASAPGNLVGTAQPVAGGGIQRTNPLAITALVLGLVTATFPAVIVGHIALAQIRRTGEGGRGMALAGLILGYVWVGVLAILLIVYFAFISSTLRYYGLGIDGRVI